MTVSDIHTSVGSTRTVDATWDATRFLLSLTGGRPVPGDLIASRAQDTLRITCIPLPRNEAILDMRTFAAGAERLEDYTALSVVAATVEDLFDEELRDRIAALYLAHGTIVANLLADLTKGGMPVATATAALTADDTAQSPTIAQDQTTTRDQTITQDQS